MDNVPFVVFFCPVSHILYDDCPVDLVRFEGIFSTYMIARIFAQNCDNRYGWRGPSGYPVHNYKICTESQWEEFINKSSQIYGGWL